MVAEVFAGLGTLKSALDLAKGLKDIDNATRRNSAVIELQEQILAAQSAQSELVESVRDLKARVVELETWDAEKQRYELKEVGLGSFAYVVKEGMRGGEPPHQICAYCYQRGHKRILQPGSTGYAKGLFCPDCKTTIPISVTDFRSVTDELKQENPDYNRI